MRLPWHAPDPGRPRRRPPCRRGDRDDAGPAAVVVELAGGTSAQNEVAGSRMRTR